MRKIVFILTLLMAPIFGQQPQGPSNPDQVQMLMGATGAIMHKMMERCRSEGYRYFLITKLTYRDGQGQRGEFRGVKPEKRGVVLKDTMSDDEIKAFGKVVVDIEVVAYRDNPQTSLAADVDAYFQMVQAFQQAQ